MFDALDSRNPTPDELARVDRYLCDFRSKFTKHEYPLEVSYDIREKLIYTYSPDELKMFTYVMGSFVGENEKKLASIYKRSRVSHEDNPYFWLPEALIIWERLQNAPDRIREIWHKRVYSDVFSLEAMGTIFAIA